VIAFLVRRFAAGILTLLVILFLTCLMARFAPGSPFTSEKHTEAEVLEELNRKYGLDLPIHKFYWRVLKDYLKGDMGPTFKYPGRNVSELVVPSLGLSLQLGLAAFVVALTAGIFFGVVAAARKNRLPDHLSMSVALTGICVPNFVVGPLLILVFVRLLGWLRPTGWPEYWPPTVGELSTMIMPVITLSLVHIAYISRLTRAGMLDVLSKDFIRTARAKGLAERRVFLRHALKNGITPVVTYAGPMAAYLVTGSIVVERVFNLNGLGTHYVESVLNRDYFLIMGTVMFYSTLVIVLNLLVDIGYRILDPRVRIS
jgi:oligopeptide transport system permease protein